MTTRHRDGRTDCTVVINKNIKEKQNPKKKKQKNTNKKTTENGRHRPPHVTGDGGIVGMMM